MSEEQKFQEFPKWVGDVIVQDKDEEKAVVARQKKEKEAKTEPKE